MEKKGPTSFVIFGRQVGRVDWILVFGAHGGDRALVIRDL